MSEGRAANDVARSAIEAAGFRDIRSDQRQPGGMAVAFTARDCADKLWLFDVGGSFTSHRGGLKRTDALWKAVAKAAVLREVIDTPLVLLTPGLPAAGSGGAGALEVVVGPGKPIHAVVEILEPSGVQQLRDLCEGRAPVTGRRRPAARPPRR